MDKPLSATAIPAVLTLLRDRQDPELLAMLRQQLHDYDTPALRELYEQCRLQPDEVSMDVATVLRDRTWRDLEEQLRCQPLSRMSLLDQLVMLASFAHVDADYHRIQAQIADLAAACRERFNDSDSVMTRAVKIADCLGRDYGYTGNTEAYYDPENSFIDSVLETRRGIPISLSALYMVVAEELGVPICGIGLPGHFIVGITDEDGRVLYLDPYRRGMILTRLDCVQLVEQLGHTFQDGYLRPVSKRYVFQRSLANLYNVYDRAGDLLRADRALTLCHACTAR